MWSGNSGQPAFLLGTAVHREWQHLGAGTGRVRETVTSARFRGADWLQVDFAPHPASFSAAGVFQVTAAALLTPG
ncbi:hypothetical protein [Deinococcus hohokamensis]|uniref:Uncharacterized protein n=1 Tax=Deinococcus hohokamensis TaxID=309883 RepID=A0ABV9ICK9_9DEIO